MTLMRLLMMIALFRCACAAGQGGFIVHFDDLQAGRAGVGASVRERDTGYLLFVRQLSQEFPTQTHVYVRRLDSSGLFEYEFEHRLGEDRDFDLGYIDPVADCPDGTTAVVIAEGYGYASEKHLYRFDTDGDTLSRAFLTTYPAEDSVYHVIRQTRSTSDGGLALIGAYDPNDQLARIFLVRVSVSGDTLWTRRYGNSNEAPVGLGVAEYPDGGFLLTGHSTPLGNLNRSFLIRTDADGNLLWRRDYGNRAAAVNGAVRIASDGGIVTWSGYRDPAWPTDWQQMMLRRWDADGTVSWEKRSHYNYFTATLDFELLPDGGMIGAGTALLDAVLARYSSTGDSLWSRAYAPAHGGSYLYDVEPTSDGGFVATGTAYRYAPVDTALQTNQIIWVVKTDSLGCVVPGCDQVGVREYALDLNEHLRVWPNPVGDQLWLGFEPPAELAPQGRLHVLVLDATGRQALSTAFTGTTLQLATDNWPPGLYHLHLSDGRRWLAGRTVVKE